MTLTSWYLLAGIVLQMFVFVAMMIVNGRRTKLLLSENYFLSGVATEMGAMLRDQINPTQLLSIIAARREERFRARVVNDFDMCKLMRRIDELTAKLEANAPYGEDIPPLKADVVKIEPTLKRGWWGRTPPTTEVTVSEPEPIAKEAQPS